jgi:hypothetical protein
MLRAVLPQRYGVARAFVVDANQRRSEQLDVVIHDRHFSPLLFEVGGARFIPAEGVYAVLEVKQKINKEQVEYAAKKIASVRRLTRTSAPIPHAGGVYEPRPLPRILGGILALDSDWSPLFGDPLRQVLAARDEDEALDLGCVLRHGGFEVQRSSSSPCGCSSDSKQWQPSPRSITTLTRRPCGLDPTEEAPHPISGGQRLAGCLTRTRVRPIVTRQRAGMGR